MDEQVMDYFVYKEYIPCYVLIWSNKSKFLSHDMMADIYWALTRAKPFKYGLFIKHRCQGSLSPDLPPPSWCIPGFGFLCSVLSELSSRKYCPLVTSLSVLFVVLILSLSLPRPPPPQLSIQIVSGTTGDKCLVHSLEAESFNFVLLNKGGKAALHLHALI